MDEQWSQGVRAPAQARERLPEGSMGLHSSPLLFFAP